MYLLLIQCKRNYIFHSNKMEQKVNLEKYVIEENKNTPIMETAKLNRNAVYTRWVCVQILVYSSY